MQRITNCVLTKEDSCLLLQKPSRGWWVAPGGKMEETESVKESVTREFREETGLQIEQPELRAVTSVVIMNNQTITNEWMMFTFQASAYSGEMLSESPEGFISWQNNKDILQLPMADGDRFLFDHVLNKKGLMYGTVYYTEDYQLMSYRLDPDPSN
ncbi:NUDIX hydrolase [Shouchella shacheensis]|uniref:NUDIX hydrolase n=1 Tax=Shouchella shacheensis TaxID=1649580 RepID=UPI00074034C3|nr:8-oxo-dGTP diphosphatase [Shouchella shacheensis]